MFCIQLSAEVNLHLRVATQSRLLATLHFKGAGQARAEWTRTNRPEI